MPKYKVPAHKPYEVVGESKSHQPRLYIPMKPEWLKKMAVGDKVDITIYGKVVGTNLTQGERPKSDVEVEVSNVSYYPSDDSAKVLMEEDEDT